MPIIAVMTGLGLQPVPQDEIKAHDEVNMVPVIESEVGQSENAPHVDNGVFGGGGKERTITTFEVGFGC